MNKFKVVLLHSEAPFAREWEQSGYNNKSIHWGIYQNNRQQNRDVPCSVNRLFVWANDLYRKPAKRDFTIDYVYMNSDYFLRKNDNFKV